MGHSVFYIEYSKGDSIDSRSLRLKEILRRDILASLRFANITRNAEAEDQAQAKQVIDLPSNLLKYLKWLHDFAVYL
jgi:hypothetical protein